MQSQHKIKLTGAGIVLDAVPLTQVAFSPFGDVVENPRPDVHPSSTDKTTTPLPLSAIVANQGSAIKYQHVSRQINLYDQAPSGRPASPVMSMFVCAARAHIPIPGQKNVSDTDHGSLPTTFPVTVLERHPYTTQTFLPLTADPKTRYLVIVAPTLTATRDDTTSLPCPTTVPPSADYPRPLPGSGMPDLRGLRAFVASAKQAVTYGAGTWHAPMVALGEKGTAVDFVVVQFANGISLEDCQEVFFDRKDGAEPSGKAAISVRLGLVVGKAKL